MIEKFDELYLEQLIVDLIVKNGYKHVNGNDLERRNTAEVLIKNDLITYLFNKYGVEGITDYEINSVISKLENLSAYDLYNSNKEFLKCVSQGFSIQREDRNKPDLFIELIDSTGITEHRKNELSKDYIDNNSINSFNIFKVVNQLEIFGVENNKRIPDCIIYINGLPLVVCEFKSMIREEVDLRQAHEQLTIRYKREIPELFKYNAICILSDGVNTKIGSFFAPYDYFYAWRKINGNDVSEKEGIDTLHTMIEGLLNKNRLIDVIQNFIFFPDTPIKENDKVVCRYPQYYAATKLLENIKNHLQPNGDGKGGTCFGATGSGKSFTMLYLTRLLMKSQELNSPTIVLITDRTDLDDQLTNQFVNAKNFIGDQNVISVKSRQHLKDLLSNRVSGGVFLTTIHKFTEDTELLTDRSNVICISDEAHRTQVNLEQKIQISESGVKKAFGFAKYLHDSLPNATYVGFTGTPIDATLNVFGNIVDEYTMNDSVKDGITVQIAYDSRAAKVYADSSVLKQIEQYYDKCAEDGATEYQIEESKKSSLNMSVILGDADRIRAVAKDFVNHYNKRSEGTVTGNAMFVCARREIAYNFYKEVLALEPSWEKEKIKMVMTRGKDDPQDLYNAIGDNDYRKELERQFKDAESKFKIAVVVDMWLTGFDVPHLDTIYIDKPIKRHNLIQAISRVNRRYPNKEKGLVVDYLGIKKQMDEALKNYSKIKGKNIEELEDSIIALKDMLDLLENMFHEFDKKPYFEGTALEKLNCLKKAAEFVQQTKDLENRFMDLVKKLKIAYDICCGSDEINKYKDLIYFYIAVRSIVFKYTKSNAPDVSQMNEKVRQMIEDAIQSDGVEELFSVANKNNTEINIYSDEYLKHLEQIELPNTKFKLLQKLLSKVIDDYKKINRFTGINFSEKLQKLIDKYNDRSGDKEMVEEVIENLTSEIINLYKEIKDEKASLDGLNISFQEKAFFDILKGLSKKHEFEYSEEDLITLAKEVKKIVDDKSNYIDWDVKEDIKASLKTALILTLAAHNYPPEINEEVYREVFEQAQNYKKHNVSEGDSI